MLPNITLEGRLVADPELKFTASGKAVCNIRVACSESKKNDRGEWEDGDRIFVGAAVWDAAGEAVAELVIKGDKVTVTGRLFQREYETSAGEKRQSLEVKFANVAKVIDAPRNPQQQQGRQGTPQATSAPASDPWATSASSNDTPPF